MMQCIEERPIFIQSGRFFVSKTLALLLILSLALPNPAWGLREGQENVADELIEALTRGVSTLAPASPPLPSNQFGSGLEEGTYAGQATKFVADRVMRQYRPRTPSITGKFPFKYDVLRQQESSVEKALVRGADGEVLIHMHSEWDDLGMLFYLDWRDDRIQGVVGIPLAEPDRYIARNPKMLQGFVPLSGSLGADEGDIIPLLNQGAWKRIQGDLLRLEEAIRSNNFFMVLAEPVDPALEGTVQTLLVSKLRPDGTGIGPVHDDWPQFVYRRVDQPPGGLEEEPTQILEQFAAASQEGTGVLVVTKAGLEEYPGLARLPQLRPEFAQRIIFMGLLGDQREQLRAAGATLINENDLDALVLALLAMPKADRVTVLEEVGTLTQALSASLPFSMRVVHLKIGAQIKAILSLFIPEEYLDRFDAEALGVLAQLLAA